MDQLGGLTLHNQVSGKCLRIILFTSSYPPNRGGVETVTERLSRELKARGHSVLVMTQRYPGTLPSDQVLSGMRVLRARYPNLLPAPGHRSAFRIAKAVAAIPLAVVNFGRLVRTIRHFRPDVVNIHYFSSATAYALLAARVVRAPTVMSFHGSDVPNTPYPASFRTPVRLACRMTAALTVNSRDLLGYLSDVVSIRDAEKIQVIPFGSDVNPNAFDVHTRAAEPSVLLVARLVEKKGVDTAIRAIGILDAEGQNVHLNIAGEGHLRGRLEDLVNSLRLGDKVSFLGSLPSKRIQRLLSEAEVALVPSHWEAYGMVTLEAMAAGLPLVATSSGGTAEIIEHETTGLLVPPRDPASMARALARLLNDAGLRASMGAAGRLRVEKCFTWAQTVDTYVEVFQAAATGPSREPQPGVSAR